MVGPYGVALGPSQDAVRRVGAHMTVIVVMLGVRGIVTPLRVDVPIVVVGVVAMVAIVDVMIVEGVGMMLSAQ